MVCVGDDPNLVKALVLRQFFSRQGSYVYMSFHVYKVLFCFFFFLFFFLFFFFFIYVCYLKIGLLYLTTILEWQSYMCM